MEDEDLIDSEEFMEEGNSKDDEEEVGKSEKSKKGKNRVRKCAVEWNTVSMQNLIENVEKFAALGIPKNDAINKWNSIRSRRVSKNSFFLFFSFEQCIHVKCTIVNCKPI